MTDYARYQRAGRWNDAARNALWWSLYFVLAVCMQLHFPGIDALLPGLLISLQEKRWRQTVWIALICVLIQEGTGTLAFGATILWYGGLILLFQGGRWFFVTNSLFFVVLLSGALGLFNIVVLLSLTTLQKLAFPLERVLEQSLAQALIIPPLWGIAILTRKKVFRHAENGV
ncbi:hypothetical protein LJC23_07860 [Desulfovibrio sp. OttesenSCG-928-I05]|nr:hypothetical protein [Desulfovibrio sp. OttesenSCG-928-I05]